MNWQALSDEARNGQRVLLHGGIFVSGGSESDQVHPVLATWDGSEWVVVENTGPRTVIRRPTHWCMLPPMPLAGEHLALIGTDEGTQIERRALACLRNWEWWSKGCLAGSDIARQLNEDVFVIHETLSELERRGLVEHVGITPNSGFVWREKVDSGERSPAQETYSSNGAHFSPVLKIALLDADAGTSVAASSNCLTSPLPLPLSPTQPHGRPVSHRS